MSAEPRVKRHYLHTCRRVLAYLSRVSVCASSSYSLLPPTAAGSLDRSHAGMKLELAAGSDASDEGRHAPKPQY